MRAVETVARALALAFVQGRLRLTPVDDGYDDSRIDYYVEHKWPQHEREAAALLRALKGQPPHVLDAGAVRWDTLRGISESFDAMLEAMART